MKTIYFLLLLTVSLSAGAQIKNDHVIDRLTASNALKGKIYKSNWDAPLSNGSLSNFVFCVGGDNNNCLNSSMYFSDLGNDFDLNADGIDDKIIELSDWKLADGLYSFIVLLGTNKGEFIYVGSFLATTFGITNEKVINGFSVININASCLDERTGRKLAEANGEITFDLSALRYKVVGIDDTVETICAHPSVIEPDNRPFWVSGGGPFGKVADCFSGDINYCIAESSECYSSIKEALGKEFNEWDVRPIQNSKTYSIAHYIVKGTPNDAPSLIFYKNKDNKQCPIIGIPSATDDVKFKFSSNGVLLEVTAKEIIAKKFAGTEKEMIFKLGQNGYFTSACTLNSALSGKTKNISCSEQNPYSYYGNYSSDEPDLSLLPPSFECSKANTQTEKLICASRYLSKLDMAIARNYRLIVSNLGGDTRALLVADQKQWLQQRNACTTKECLFEMYQNRLEVLCQKYSSSILECLISSDVR